MTRSALDEYAAVVRPRYKAARKAAKTKILDEFCQTTGMHRKAAVRLLNRDTGPKRGGRGRPPGRRTARLRSSPYTRVASARAVSSSHCRVVDRSAHTSASRTIVSAALSITCTGTHSSVE